MIRNFIWFGRQFLRGNPAMRFEYIIFQKMLLVHSYDLWSTYKIFMLRTVIINWKLILKWNNLFHFYVRGGYTTRKTYMCPFIIFVDSLSSYSRLRVSYFHLATYFNPNVIGGWKEKFFLTISLCFIMRF